MSYDVIVVGGLNTDFVARGDRLPSPGETQEGSVFIEGPGGKGANQAVAAARLGARVAFVGVVGADERGEALVAEGIDTRAILIRGEQQTGAAVIHVNGSAEKQILAVLGANGLLQGRDVARGLELLGRAGVVVTQLEVPLEAVEAALASGRAAGAVTLLDPAPAAELQDRLLALVDVLKPNSSEAQVLTSRVVHDRDSAREAARTLIGRGVGAVTIQAGDHGNLLVTRSEEHWYPRIEVEAVDATGAGDAFAGTLAARLARGDSLAEAARLANAAAAFATTAIGAQGALAREQDLQALLDRTVP